MALKKDRLHRWMQNYNLEVSAKESQKLINLKDSLPTGIKIYLPHIYGKDFEKIIIKPSQLIQKLGYLPIPHLAARNIKDEAELEKILKLIKELAIEEVLVLGGGINPPAGKFESSMDLLKAVSFSDYGIKKIGIAGHPEKHPNVSEPELLKALQDKQSFAAKNNLEIYIITQFCFSTDAVIDWLNKLKQAEINMPIRLGSVGIVNVISLLKYAVQCGVGNSLKLLKSKYKDVMHLAAKYKTEEFFLPLLEKLQDEHPSVEGLHLFSFGSSKKTTGYFKEWTQKSSP